MSGSIDPGPAGTPARLEKRADFLATARGIRVHHVAFTLQAGRRGPAGRGVAPAPRFGLTVTRKVGTATERNRIRRRLREALRHAKTLSTEPETDYVIVARRDVLSLPFARLIADLEGAVRKAGGKLASRRPGPAPRRPDDPEARTAATASRPTPTCRLPTSAVIDP